MKTDNLEHRLRDAIRSQHVPEPQEKHMESILSRRSAGERVLLPTVSPRFTAAGVRWTIAAVLAAAASIVAVSRLSTPVQPGTSSVNAVVNMLGPELLLAQATDHPTFPVIHTGRSLPARSWRYAWREIDSLVIDSNATWVGERRSDSYQSKPAYRYDYSTLGNLKNRVLSDTVWLDSVGFLPFARQATSPTGHHITQEFKATSVLTGFTAPSGWTQWYSEEYNTSFFYLQGDSTRRPAPKFAGLAGQVGTWRLQILTALEAASLGPDWKGSLEIISAPGGFWATRFWLNFQVRGEERVTLPAGTFDTWKVQVGEENPFLVWVSQSDHQVVQIGTARGTMREVLLETAPN